MASKVVNDAAKLQTLAEGTWCDDDLELIANHSSSSGDLFRFIYALQYLCAKGKAHGIFRRLSWQELDINGNGIVSLAETGGWLKTHLINFYAKKEQAGFGVGGEDAVLLYKHFYPSFIRAFLDAADWGSASKVTQKGGGKRYSANPKTDTTTDDYVQFGEFRLLVTYLCIYATIWEAFGDVDGKGKGIDATDDRRISKDEWLSKGKSLAGHPLLSLSVSANMDADAVFSAMDADGKGKVLLAEFSTYIEDYEFALGTRWGQLLNAGEGVSASAGAAVSASS